LQITIYIIKSIHVALLSNSTPLGSSWSCSYGSWIYNYLCNQRLSATKLWVRTPFMARCARYNIMWQSGKWLATGRWFSPGTPISSTNETDHHDITDILLKVALNTINNNNRQYSQCFDFNIDCFHVFIGNVCIVCILAIWTNKSVLIYRTYIIPMKGLSMFTSLSFNSGLALLSQTYNTEFFWFCLKLINVNNRQIMYQLHNCI
jgi:hypothetical protein